MNTKKSQPKFEFSESESSYIYPQDEQNWIEKCIMRPTNAKSLQQSKWPSWKKSREIPKPFVFWVQNLRTLQARKWSTGLMLLHRYPALWNTLPLMQLLLCKLETDAGQKNNLEGVWKNLKSSQI